MDYKTRHTSYADGESATMIKVHIETTGCNVEERGGVVTTLFWLSRWKDVHWTVEVDDSDGERLVTRDDDADSVRISATGLDSNLALLEALERVVTVMRRDLKPE